MVTRANKELFGDEMLAAMQQTTEVTVSEWADNNRVLDARSSAEPGPYSTDRTPYMREIMDAFSDPEVEKITIEKPVQSGGTEALYNMLAWLIDQDPSPTMLVMPRDDDYKYAAENRLKPMVELSDTLSRHLTGRAWDIKNKEFYFDRMTLYLAGSNSPAGMSSKSCRILLRDEVNKFPSFAGKEASPIALSEKRTVTFWDRKIVDCSTPTTKTGYITVEYKRSNQCRYYIPCPHCGEYREWIFSKKTLRIPKNLRDPDEIRRSEGKVYYQCENCEGRIQEADKNDCVAKGVWLAKGQKINKKGIITGRPKRSKKHSGFHFTALISPFISWVEIMAQWFEANTPEGISIGALMDFRNSILAQVWEETSIEVDPSKLYLRGSEFRRATVPSNIRALTLGADYHKTRRGDKRIVYEVRGFGNHYRNCVIDSGTLSRWDDFANEVLTVGYNWADKDNQAPPLGISCAFFDSGYLPDDVYGFCLKYPGFCFPTKGRDTQHSPIMTTALEKSARQAFYRKKGSLLYWLDTDFFKSQVTSWADAPDDDIRQTRYYAEIPEVYFDEFTGEHKIKVRAKRGVDKYIWEVIQGREVHFLDTAVQAAAAAYYLGVYRMKPTQKKTETEPAKKSGKTRKLRTRY